MRVGADPRSALPADLYDREPIVGMLAGYEFGAFFLALRRLGCWSQQTFGGIVGLDQSQASAIERGEYRLRNIELIAGLAQALQIPAVRLNFPDIRATVDAQGDAGQKDVSWVDRRDFGGHVAGLVLGIAGATGLDVDRLLALLPQAEPTDTRHVGAADVDFIEQLTAAFARQDFAHGSRLSRDAAVSQLYAVLPLLDAQIDSELRPRLMVATAHLATQTGWMSYECQQHDAARRLWMIALDLTRKTEHPQAADLTAFLLYDMALQSVHLQRPDEARHLVRVGDTVSAGPHPVSASTMCCLAAAQARAYAAEGDAAGCERALGRAEEHFTAIDPASTPPWGGHVREATMSGFRGIAGYTLGVTNRDARTADRTVPLLRHAVDHFGPGYARFRGFTLPDLAGAHALAGDTDTAVTVGHQAIDAVTALASPRAHDRLHTLHAVLAPLHTSPGVADLRDRLATTAA